MKHQIITARTAYDIAVRMHAAEARDPEGFNTDGHVLRLLEKETNLMVEAIYVPGTGVCIATFYGRPRADGGNIAESHLYKSVKAFYRAFKLNA